MRTRPSLQTWGFMTGALGALAVLTVMALGLADAALGLIIGSGFLGAAVVMGAVGAMTRSVESHLDDLAHSARTLAADRIDWAARIGPDCLDEIPASAGAQRSDALGELARWHDRLLVAAVHAAAREQETVAPAVAVPCEVSEPSPLRPAVPLAPAPYVLQALERMRLSARAALDGDHSLGVRLGVEHAIAQLERAQRTGALLCGLRPTPSTTEPLELGTVLERAIAAADGGFDAVVVPAPVHGGVPVAVLADTADDLVHLLAELIDQARAACLPGDPIVVRGGWCRDGRLITLSVPAAPAGSPGPPEAAVPYDRATLIAQLARPHAVVVSSPWHEAGERFTEVLVPDVVLVDPPAIAAGPVARPVLRLVSGGKSDAVTEARTSQGPVVAALSAASIEPVVEPVLDLVAAEAAETAEQARRSLMRWQHAVAVARARAGEGRAAP